MQDDRKPSTVQDLFDRKRALIAGNRADLRRCLAGAPKTVRREYARCRDRIRRLLRVRDAGTAVEATLYPRARPKRLTDLQLAWLFDLLSHPANGWDVRLSKPLGGDGELRLLFRFDPHAD